MAAELDGQAEYVCGALSSDPEKSKKSGAALYLDTARVYKDYKEMAAKEAAFPADKRIDFVTIVTPILPILTRPVHSWKQVFT